MTMPGNWPSVVVKEPRSEDATFCDTMWACLLNDYDAEDDNSTVYSALSAAEKYTTEDAKSKSRRLKKEKAKRKAKEDGREETADSDSAEEPEDSAKQNRDEAPTDGSRMQQSKSSEHVESPDVTHDQQVPSAPSHEKAPPSPPAKSTTDPEDTNEIQRMREKSTVNRRASNSRERVLPVQKSRKKLALEKEKSQRSTRISSKAKGGPDKETSPEKERSQRNKRTTSGAVRVPPPREKEKPQRRSRTSRKPPQENKRVSKSTRATRTIDAFASEKSPSSTRVKRTIPAPLEKEKSRRSMRESKTAPTDAPAISSSQFSSIEEYQQSVLESRRRAERKLALKRIREIKAKLATKEDP